MKRQTFRISTYWICQLAGWLGMVCIELINYTFFIVGRFSFFVMNMFLLCAAAGLLFTHLYRQVIRKRIFYSNALSKLWLNAFLSTLAIAILMTVVTELFLVAMGRHEGITFLTLAGTTMNWMRYVGVWIIIYFLYKMLQQNTRIQQEKWQIESLAKTTELELLKSQLNPHFLFNALNSIKALVNVDPEQSRDAIVKLSELLRFTLQYGKETFISLKAEMEEVKKYLQLEQMRFGKRLQVSYRTDDALNKHPVPPALLLTLVENAIKHGVARQMGNGSIEIQSGLAANGELRITVINSGRFEPGNTQGIGLKHLSKRLEELYHGKASFRIAQKDELVFAELQLPVS